MQESIKALLDQATKRLQAYESPRSEAMILLCHALGKERLWVIIHEDAVCESKPYLELVRRRVEGEPIEYITNAVSFYSETFFIKEGALIPRPETEMLIDKVLEHVSLEFNGHIVEVGTGSGIIAIMLALKLPKARITAIDIAKEALDVAHENVKDFGLSDRITLVQGDLLDPIIEKIDVLVSNPPYIKEGELLERPLGFEPQNALFGGIVGDEILKALMYEAHKRDIGMIACEMGYDQKKPMQEYIESLGSFEVEFYKDLAGFDRGFVAQKEHYA